MIIQIALTKNYLGSAIERIGFDDSIETELIILGVLENLVNLQQEKIKIATQVTQNKNK